MKVLLNILERLKLLEILPSEGNYATLKIMRKLRETLSLSEEEFKKVTIQYEYSCPQVIKNNSGDVVSICGNRGFFPPNPKCAIHNTPMTPTGQMRFMNTASLFEIVKEIYLGDEACANIKTALKALSDTNKLRADQENLYDKFFTEDKDKED